jgi:hypothetical protein
MTMDIKRHDRTKQSKQSLKHYEKLTSRSKLYSIDFEEANFTDSQYHCSEISSNKFYSDVNNPSLQAKIEQVLSLLSNVPDIHFSYFEQTLTGPLTENYRLVQQFGEYISIPYLNTDDNVREKHLMIYRGNQFLMCIHLKFEYDYAVLGDRWLLITGDVWQIEDSFQSFRNLVIIDLHCSKISEYNFAFDIRDAVYWRDDMIIVFDLKGNISVVTLGEPLTTEVLVEKGPYTEYESKLGIYDSTLYAILLGEHTSIMEYDLDRRKFVKEATHLRSSTCSCQIKIVENHLYCINYWNIILVGKPNRLTQMSYYNQIFDLKAENPLRTDDLDSDINYSHKSDVKTFHDGIVLNGYVLTVEKWSGITQITQKNDKLLSQGMNLVLYHHGLPRSGMNIVPDSPKDKSTDLFAITQEGIFIWPDRVIKW